MSFAFIVMMVLLGSSVAIAFVLQPSEEELATRGNSGSHRRCQGESLQSISRGLLAALKLQAEPRLPAGTLDGIRERWMNTFGAAAQRAEAAAASPISGCSVSPDGGNQCCPLVTEISMKDLGWDSWVIHPPSLTVVQCALCDPRGNAEQSSHTHVQDSDSQVQVPCCQPTSQDLVPIIYMDESYGVIITSVSLTRSCGSTQLPCEE